MTRPLVSRIGTAAAHIMWVLQVLLDAQAANGNAVLMQSCSWSGRCHSNVPKAPANDCL